MAPTLVTIKDHHKLAPGAAGSYKRAQADGMPGGDINSADRTREEQKELYDLYKAGKGNPAAKPGTSKHELGLALDLDDDNDWGGSARDWMEENGASYGWVRTNDEPWHFEYVAAKDNKLKALKARQAVIAKAAARGKVKKIQKILGVTTDGDPRAKTEAAWDKLVAAAK